jgi:tetratricopeptide (TPR) repeat protein
VREPTTFTDEETFDERLTEWQANPTLPYASDLLSVAVVLNRFDAVRDAAEFVLSPSVDAPLAARRLANRALSISEEEAPDDSVAGHEQRLRAALARARARLRLYPRDPLVLVDQSRLYALAGRLDKAQDAMRRAVALAPDDRFVLRSAARLNLHQHNPNEALRLLRGSTRTRVDPWLLAAEVAAASVAGKSTRYVREGRRILASDLDPWHLNELASAFGTLEIQDGTKSHARRLFTQALRAPTDNTIAQVQWAERYVPSLTLSADMWKRPRVYEARAWDKYASGHWREAFAASEEWLKDELFASRPALMGTFVSAVLLEDFEASARIARIGLHANPDEQVLRNNLVFALASAGRIDEAEKEASTVRASHLTEIGGQIAWTATRGLLAFRRGRFDEGRSLYMQALDGSKAYTQNHAFAAAFLAREEIIARTPEASGALQRAENNAKTLGSMAVGDLLERLRRLAATLDALRV